MLVVVTSGASTIRVIVKKRSLRFARAGVETQVWSPGIASQVPCQTRGERGRVTVGLPLRIPEVCREHSSDVCGAQRLGS